MAGAKFLVASSLVGLILNSDNFISWRISIWQIFQADGKRFCTVVQLPSVFTSYRLTLKNALSQQRLEKIKDRCTPATVSLFYISMCLCGKHFW
jgi:hypothetical protein